jgi:hypothetical protein
MSSGLNAIDNGALSAATPPPLRCANVALGL